MIKEEAGMKHDSGKQDSVGAVWPSPLQPWGFVGLGGPGRLMILASPSVK